MNILLDDLPYNSAMFPFGQVRSIVHMRIGILTLFEKWTHFFPGKVFVASEMKTTGLASSFDVTIPANILPSNVFLQRLAEGTGVDNIVESGKTIHRPWEILQVNDWALREDFELLTKDRTSQDIPGGTRIVGRENIFIETGAKIYFSVLNAERGPIYIGKDALVMEGCLMQGPVSIGSKAVVKMGTKIYGASTLGPNSVVGGEIKNAILMDWSNKAHDGYLGDSIIDEWCNLGAGTSNSNIKNNASEVKVWANDRKTFISAGLKCGLLMGSYSRSAINTSFNTGTVVGCSCNIFSRSFPPKFIDNFTWGEEPYYLEKALKDIDNWKKLKGKEISNERREALINLYKKSNYEKTDSGS